MTKLLRNFLLLAVCLLCCAGVAHAAQAPGKPLVLVLPYQVNAAQDAGQIQADLPALIHTQLQNAGFRVAPVMQGRALLRNRDVETLDVAEARKLAAAAGAQYVVYGTLNQLGEGFTLDSRWVPVDARTPSTPITIQKGHMLELSPAAADLANQAVAASGGHAVPAEAATPASTPSVPLKGDRVPGSIADIQVHGLRVLDPDVVLMRLSIRKGDSPDEAAINEEVKRVWDMGYFSDVQAAVTPGNVLVFTVVEKPRVDNIVVEGADAVDKDDVLAAMGTKTGAVLNDRVLADDLQKVTELYRKEGYYLASVTHRVEQRPGAAGSVLYLTVNEGKKLYISEVRVEGLSGINRGDLDDYMALRKRNILSWFTGSGVLKEEYLERDSNAIAAYALNQGYVDVQVSAPQVDYTPDGIVITFTVNEGPRYAISEVRFAGDMIDTKENLFKVIKMEDQRKDEKYFSLSVMQEDTKKLTQYYADQGYAFAEVDTKILKDEDGAHTLSVGYLIKKKQKVFIRRAVVEGNQKTRDNVILRELRLADGDEYNGEKLRRSVERLNRLRYFSAVDTELVPTDKEEEVDLKVKVKEANTGAIMGGVGYSTYYDVGVTASIMERNLLGRGYWLQLQGFVSWRRTSGILSFTNPRVYDTDLSIGNDLYYTHDYWDTFTKDTAGDTIRLAYPIGEYTTVGLGYRLERYHLYHLDPYASRSIRDYKGVNWTSALSVRLTRDTTDVRDRPTNGTITRLWVEYGGGGLGGNDNFVKAVADWQGFYTWRPDHTLHGRVRVGGVFENSKEVVPVFERFYVGGIDTIRGYSYTDLSPRDRYWHDHIGGDRMGVINLEYVWTFQKELGLALVPFVDMGFNIDSKFMDLADHWVYSAGLELRWRSPMGDLRIAYGVPLSKDYDGENPPGRLEFTMGQFF